MWEYELVLCVGEMPGKWPGDCQLDMVEGESAGEVSSLSEVATELFGSAVCGATESMPSAIRFRWLRCFSNIPKRPSLVKGLGKTSFIPATVSKVH